MRSALVGSGGSLRLRAQDRWTGVEGRFRNSIIDMDTALEPVTALDQALLGQRGSARQEDGKAMEQRRKEYRPWRRCIAAGRQLSYLCQDGQKGNPG